MERVSLVAEKRGPGKGAARKSRVAGRVPAVLYGKGVKSVNISVDRRELNKVVKTKSGMNVIIDLSVKDGDSGLVLIRDYQADPFKREFTHVDFQKISLEEKIDVEVPIILTGTSVGVKEGGIVEQLMRTFAVRALPGAIPDKIEIDITDLKIGDGIHSNEVKIPKGVEFSSAVNYTVVSIVPPVKEEVVAAPVAAVEGEAPPAEGAAPAPAEGAAPAKGAAPAAPAEGAAKAAPAKGEEKKK